MSMVGIDIGGTFTDLVAYRDGAILTAKTLTVPDDPIDGAAAALRIAGCEMTAIDELLHGSTIAINTVLERTGAKTALVTTEGFRDVYALGRGNRPDAFNLDFHRPRPLVPRDLTFEVRERMNAAGDVLVPIEPAAVETLGRNLEALGIEAVAIAFLHAYVNPAHEIAAGEALRHVAPALFVTTSHEILREFREYERTSTTALNAFVGPRVGRYLARFEGFAREANFTGRIAIMRSSGGTMSIAEARRAPVAMMESGPVAGMIGAGHLARLLGIDQAIGFDMGGTTAKTALIAGELPVAQGYVIGDAFTGQPMQLPVVDIIEVGAGGGSIAWCDDNGGLHVGPLSAGADPGPACYGRGGARPTVTDADLVLGRLNGERFLGGGMKLDRAAAATAIREGIGGRLSLDPVAAACGIATIADGAMSLAVRAVSVDRGIDPRDTAVIAFGGAGPLHAASIAREISIPKLVVPKLPGTFSALGMLMAQWRQDFVRTLIGELDRIAPDAAARAFADLRMAGEQALGRDRLAGGRFAFAADLRYRGQEHTIPVAVDGPDDLAADVASTRRRFDEQHGRRHGHAAPDQSVEIVNLRLVVRVPRLNDAIERWLSEPFRPERAATEQRRAVVFDDPQHPVEARILWRPGLAAGTQVDGPAVIEEANATTLVPPGDHARIDPWGNIVITIAERM